jgi:hypothetical protein
VALIWHLADMLLAPLNGALAGFSCEKYRSSDPSVLNTGQSRMLTVSLLSVFGLRDGETR